MAIQIVNLAVPNGDTPRSANTKINANFSDQTNAASRLLGSGKEQVPLGKDVYKAAYLDYNTPYLPNGANGLNDLPAGSLTLVHAGAVGAPASQLSNSYFTVETQISNSSGLRQIAWNEYSSDVFSRVRYAGVWRDWLPLGTTSYTYTTTTASGANVVVDTNGKLMRSTSSEQYKDILAPLELDDARYADAMALKPIVYRSTADADNPAYHFYSFSAEELGAYDPAFTLWRETETVTDEDGNVTEQPLAERQAEGININALLAMSHAIAIKQGGLIKDLQEQIDALKLKLEV